MKKIKLYMTIFLIFAVVYGCSKSTTKLDEVDMSTEYEIMVRNNLEDDYVVVTDEVIKFSLEFFLILWLNEIGEKGFQINIVYTIW